MANLLKQANIKQAAPKSQYVAGVTPVPPFAPAATAAFNAPRGQKTKASLGAGAGSTVGMTTGALPGLKMLSKGKLGAGALNALLGSAAGSAVGSGLGYDIALGQF